MNILATFCVLEVSDCYRKNLDLNAIPLNVFFTFEGGQSGLVLTVFRLYTDFLGKSLTFRKRLRVWQCNSLTFCKCMTIALIDIKECNCYGMGGYTDPSVGRWSPLLARLAQQNGRQAYGALLWCVLGTRWCDWLGLLNNRSQWLRMRCRTY